jgi:hypothetical protein
MQQISALNHMGSCCCGDQAKEDEMDGAHIGEMRNEKRDFRFSRRQV